MAEGLKNIEQKVYSIYMQVESRESQKKLKCNESPHMMKALVWLLNHTKVSNASSIFSKENPT